jgi:hypothetical protein
MTETANIATALSELQAEMPVVAKSKKARVPTKSGGSYEYTYAGLAEVSEAALPLLSKHGLAFSACPRGTDHGYELAGILLHTSGERIEGALPIYGNSPQEIGSAITYARRYLLGSMTGLVTDDDDDDGTAAQGARRTEKPMTTKTRGQMFALFGQKGIAESAQLAGINQITGKAYESRGDLTESDARAVIEALKKRPDVPPPTAASAAICPECTAGKHVNCSGQAWDNAADEPVPCACGDESHGGA